MTSDSEEYNTDEDGSKVSNVTGRSSRGRISAHISGVRRSRYSNNVGSSRPIKSEMSTDSEEEDELDQRGLSPRTRMSITGVRPQDMSDDSSEIEYSDNGSNVKRNDNASPRYTTQFKNSIEDTLHSTLAQSPEFSTSPKNDSSDSDVLILSNKEPPIEVISSTEDDSYKESVQAPQVRGRKSRDFSPRSTANVPQVKSSKLVQPTIKAAIKKTTSSQLVSQEFYEKESLKLSDLKAKLNEAVKLHEKVSHKLPDKGLQIRKRIDALRQDIDIKSKYIEGLNVQTIVPQVKLTRSEKLADPNTETELNWDQLSADVNRIQPVHTGTQGLATFNKQKSLTLDLLKNLHDSLKGCPRETVLADDPPGLKVKLMNHQKHALAWMSWREQQRPRGGILADDMGLGKTLTMISLVIASKIRKGNAAGASSDEEEQDTANYRKSKGRKDAYPGGTLVVCPASLLRQWEGEVGSKMSHPRLSVYVHHGANREARAKQMAAYDMVVTTYNIVARDDKDQGPLYGVDWHRIILDEAHVVRNHKAQSSLAVSALRGKFRWALTGTPIQNKELDVYALLKFLRCSPFDDLSTWKAWIENKSRGGPERLGLLMKSLMLRRTKAKLHLDGKLNSLPQKEVRLMEMSLDTDEMNVYQRVMTYSRTLFAQFLFQRAEKDSDANFIADSGKPSYRQIQDPNGAYYKLHEKFASMAGQNKEVKSHEILTLLLRLRQICCHPGLIDAMLEDGTDEMDHRSSAEIDLLAQLNKLSINETSGPSQRSSNSRKAKGVDEARLAEASQNVLKRSNPVFNLNRPSSKMLKVLEILKTSVLTTTDKAIVVSQWTTVLDIVRDLLHKERLNTLSLNGSVPVKDRQNIVNEFNDPSNPKRILLLSLTAGGVGLNLIGANQLILLDLHWNPQLEAQAQDRIYRVGQQKNVIIYKIVCVDTVEQRIKALQDRKLELADGVLTGKVSSKLTINDLKGLFGM